MNSSQNYLFSKYIDWEDEYLEGSVSENLLAILSTLKIRLVTTEIVLDRNSSA